MEHTEPENNYLVLAQSHNQVRVWARQYGVSMIRLRYVDPVSPTQFHGSYDYSLLVLGSLKYDPDLLTSIYQRAKSIYDVRFMYPVTETGKIVRWKFFGDGQEHAPGQLE